jgi:hypothetical protein
MQICFNQENRSLSPLLGSDEMEDNNSPEWSHKVAEEQSTENNFER